jgi:replicative DNA helicase
MESAKVTEYEEALIAVALQHSEGVHAVIDMHIGDFYVPHCRIVAKTIKELFSKNEPVDLVSVSTAMPVSEAVTTKDWRVRLTDLVLAFGHNRGSVMHYVRAIQDAAHRRAFTKLLRESGDSLSAGAEPTSDAISSHLQKLARLIARDEHKQLERSADLLDGYLERLREREQNPAEALGADTGIPELNQHTTGFKEGQFIVIGGRPGMGKTSLMLCMAATQAITMQMCINFYSLEMSRDSIMQKLIALQSGVHTMKLRTGQGLNQYDWELIERACERIRGAQLYIADERSGIRTIGGIKAAEEKQKMRGVTRHGDYLDYIQLVRGEKETENRTQEVSQISRDCEEHAAQEAIFVAAGSQLSRDLEKRQDKRPVLSDLRESGSLEQDADIVMFVYREEVYNPDTDKRGEAEIIIAKQREGGLATVTTLFDPHLQKFIAKAGDKEIGQQMDFTPPKNKKPIAICFPMLADQLAFEVENGDDNEMFAAYEKCVYEAETDEEREIAQRNLELCLRLIEEKAQRRAALPPEPAEDDSPCWYTQM